MMFDLPMNVRFTGQYQFVGYLKDVPFIRVPTSTVITIVGGALVMTNIANPLYNGIFAEGTWDYVGVEETI